MRNWIFKLLRNALDGGRSPNWPEARRLHLEREGKCQWCGGTKDLEVHHIAPFHLHPDLELSESNFITLCESMDKECHLHRGHLGNWKAFNPRIREQCRERMRVMGYPGPTA